MLRVFVLALVSVGLCGLAAAETASDELAELRAIEAELEDYPLEIAPEARFKLGLISAFLPPSSTSPSLYSAVGPDPDPYTIYAEPDFESPAIGIINVVAGDWDVEQPSQIFISDNTGKKSIDLKNSSGLGALAITIRDIDGWWSKVYLSDGENTGWVWVKPKHSQLLVSQNCFGKPKLRKSLLILRRDPFDGRETYLLYGQRVNLSIDDTETIGIRPACESKDCPPSRMRPYQRFSWRVLYTWDGKLIYEPAPKLEDETARS